MYNADIVFIIGFSFCILVCVCTSLLTWLIVNLFFNMLEHRALNNSYPISAQKNSLIILDDSLLASVNDLPVNEKVGDLFG